MLIGWEKVIGMGMSCLLDKKMSGIIVILSKF